MSMLDEVGTGRLATATSDVGAARERARSRRLARMAPCWRCRSSGCGGGSSTATRSTPPPWHCRSIDPFLLIVGVFFVVMIFCCSGMTLIAGRSPHVDLPP